MNESIRTALAADLGVLRRADHRDLATRIDRALRQGDLIALFPGVYVAAGTQNSLEIQMRAIAAAAPDAVVTGWAAATAHRWEVPRGRRIDVASLQLQPRAWIRVEERSVPAPLIMRPRRLRLTRRPLTALDLVPELGPEALYVALRSGVTPAAVAEAFALTPKRRGNRARAAAVAACANNAWSAAEAAAHLGLVTRGVTGWVANRVVAGADPTERFVLDIAFEDLRLGFEIDGRAYHGSREQFEHDRERVMRYAELGWEVIRVTAASVLANPDAFARRVRTILQVRRGDRSGWR